jgi:hypothetical protein
MRFAIQDRRIETLLRQTDSGANHIGTGLDPNFKFLEDLAQDLSSRLISAH